MGAGYIIVFTDNAIVGWGRRRIGLRDLWQCGNTILTFDLSSRVIAATDRGGREGLNTVTERALVFRSTSLDSWIRRTGKGWHCVYK